MAAIRAGSVKTTWKSDFCKADHSQIQPGHWAAGEGRRQARDVFRPEKLSEAQLCRILTKYAAYYNELRINRSLNKDAPFHRAIQRLGAVTSLPVLGGLHHQYCRI
jgi:hypothetical protein